MKKRIGILSSCFVMMSYLAISPVLASIAEEFPEVSVSLIQMLITLPSLVSLVFSLLAGKLAEHFYKKTLILISMAMYLVGGLLPLALNHNVWILLLCSGIMGVGTGGMITLTSAIVCDYYEWSDRNQMMGLQSAFISGGGMVFTMLGGWLSGFGWRAAYLAFLLLIPCFIIAVICLPKGVLEKQEEESKKRGIPGYVWFMSLMGFLFYVFQNSFNTNISLYMNETGLGTARTASIATSVNTFAGLLAGCLLWQVMSRLKKYTVPAAFLMAALGLFLTYVGGSFVLIILGGFFIGFGFSTYTPAGTCLVSERVDVSQRPMSIAVLSASNNIGAALSPVIVNNIAGCFGPSVQIKFLISAVVLLGVTAAAAVKFRMEK